jgi:hypothetical protein
LGERIELFVLVPAGQADESRYAKLNTAFSRLHGNKPELLARSPGTVLVEDRKRNNIFSLFVGTQKI